MSVRESQGQTRSTYSPQGGKHLLLHRAVVASTSLLAISAAMGWADPAMAAGTCGAPVGGTANCNATAYPTGIIYTGLNAVDDLTVNVGTFAGQNGAVTVSSPGIVIASNIFSASDTSETLNVGANVTIDSATYNGISVISTSSHTSAADAILNEGSITAAGTGIFGYAAIISSAGSANASGSITNTGDITAGHAGLVQDAFVSDFSATLDVTASASANVQNAGVVTSVAAGIYASTIASAAAASGSANGLAHSYAANGNSVTTSGDGAVGVGAATTGLSESFSGAHAYGAFYATAVNAGSVTTSGLSAAGVYAFGLGESIAYSGVASAIVGSTGYNAGTITTTGATAYGVAGGIKYYGQAATGISSISTSVAVGYQGSLAQATATAENTGAISTSGTFAHGINVSATASSIAGGFYYSQSVATATAINTGTINVTGAGARGINANSYAYSGITISGGYATPNGAYYGTAEASTTVENTGTITTTGGLSYTAAGGVKTYKAASGIYANSYAVSGGYGGSSATANTYAVNLGTISTTGTGARGIDAHATAVALSYFGSVTAGAYTKALNAGIISTTGAGAAGIYAATTAAGISGYRSYAYSEATAINAGSVTTAGPLSAGMVAVAKAATNGFYANSYASASAVNAGSIKTSGAGSVGIYVLAGDTATGVLGAPYANASAVNAGSVATSGDGAAGIVAISSTYSPGEFVYSAAHSSTTNAGSISTTGLGSAGMYAYSTSTASSPGGLLGDGNGKTYASSTGINVGSISTTGDGAVGMAGVSKTHSYAVYYSHAVSVSDMTNAGSISTAGAGAHGIVAQATSLAYTPFANPYTTVASSTAKALNAGPVTVTGAGANGILAYSSAIAVGSSGGASATATTSVTNAGAVSSAQGDGIFAVSSAYANSAANAQANASTLVINAGSVTSSGTGTDGVFAASLAATGAGSVAASATVVNAGDSSIKATGVGGIGVVAEAAYATVVTYTGSTIVGGTGVGAAGVYENGALNIIANGGSISSGNDRVIVMNGLAANIIKNTGTIAGYVTMHGTGPAEQNVFYNYGTWVARGGNSDFKHTAGGGSNLVNEPGGTIVVVGDQAFTNLDKFTNLNGLITMTQAASAGLGARPTFEKLTVSGDYDGIAGTLAVDATTAGSQNGDRLIIDGDTTGITDVKVTILGTPGQTTGNGILLVDGKGTVTGAGNFVLAGNANGGHSQVDGAFEYNLAFTPGAGGSGEWFLQSEVYPGVSQFGQIGSSSALIADSVNPTVDDLLNQVMGNPAKVGMIDQPTQVASVDDSFVPSPNGPGVSGWGRFFESRFNVDPNGSPFADYKLRVDSVQAGIDYNWHNASNVVMVGGYIVPFHAWSDFSLLGGHIGTSGTAYGVYGLWFNGPWQAGLRLNTTDMTAHVSDTFIGTSASTHPNEQGAQGEVSYDMPLSWADFTPSAELNYGTTSGVHFTDGAGDLVKVGDTNDFWGKLNGRFSTDVITDRGLLVQPYANIGLLYRGDSATRVSIGGFSSSTNINGWNGDFAVGVNTNLAQGLSLSAQADYIAGSRVDGWQGFIGLRYTPGGEAAPPPPPPMAPPPPPAPPPATKTFIVFFDFNKSNLTAEAESVVSEAVKSAKTNGMVRVLVTGHTDTVGSDSYNMGLSVRRAQSVKDEMVRQGMDGSGISIEGKGFHDPLVPTGPGVREPQNRRAVIDLGG